MKYITGENREQQTFLPDCIEDYVGKDSPVRVIDAFVNNLDMEELGFKRAKAKETGMENLAICYAFADKLWACRISTIFYQCVRRLELQR